MNWFDWSKGKNEFRSKPGSVINQRIGITYFLDSNMECFFIHVSRKFWNPNYEKIDIFSFALHRPSNEDIHKMTGFVSRRSRPAGPSRRQRLDFIRWPCVELHREERQRKSMIHVVWTWCVLTNGQPYKEEKRYWDNAMPRGSLVPDLRR